MNPIITFPKKYKGSIMEKPAVFLAAGFLLYKLCPYVRVEHSCVLSGIAFYEKS